MKIRDFIGFEDFYPEAIEGTDSWYYGQITACAEAYEVPEFEGNYSGTRLCFFEYPSGKVFEPIAQEKNVFLETPVYDRESDSFGIIVYDFNKQSLKAVVYYPKESKLQTLVTLPFSAVGDVSGIRMLVYPYSIIKSNFINDEVDFLFPEKKHILLEKNENICFLSDGNIHTSKWIENPDYHEEMLIRDGKTFEVLDRKAGFFRKMADGSLWRFTK